MRDTLITILPGDMTYEVITALQDGSILPTKAIVVVATEDASAIHDDALYFIVSAEADVPMVAALEPYIVAEADREDGLQLPDGIVGLSTVWVGMSVRSP